ncbi:MAG: rhomboid family intramembrane serine protease [Firmicutes bacterium HGW-Firmicutes-15]|nr:MAG: rhomboid family intramembrane serine protease [Firmicutes bacterium HGW-Firmicutes-15]
MIPLRDSTRSDHFPLITIILILINTLVFYYEISLGQDGMNRLSYVFGLVPSYYTNNHVPLIDYLPFITTTFLHGSWMHLIGNMWILWLFGDNVEDKMGKARFIAFYLICGLLASLTHYAFNLSSEVPVVGASGAVAGVMGAYFLMFRKAKVLTFIPPFFLFNFPAWIYLGFWALTQVYGGATGLLSVGGNQEVAFWAHIGGFLAGMLLFKLFLRPRQYREA